MKEDVLIVLSAHDFSFQAIKASEYDVEQPYIGNRMPIRLLREAAFRFDLPGKSFWYNKRINNKANTYVVYNALITVDYMYWLRKQNPDSRIIYLYTDPVDMAISPDKLPDEICEKWSSDYLDCDKYGLHKGLEGGYFKSWKVEKSEPEYDVFFIGRDKGRLSELLGLKEQFESLGLKTNFYITAHHRWQRFNNPIYQPLVPYTEVLKMLGKTRAILHLTEGGYKGMSIRVMESVIHGIKLISDNKHLLDMDIYRPDNMFILGVDDINDLPAFLDRPFIKYDERYIESLSFENTMKYMVKA